GPEPARRIDKLAVRIDAVAFDRWRLSRETTMRVQASIAVLACASSASFAQTSLWQHRGPVASASSGAAICSTPDVDGDGRRDLVLTENAWVGNATERHVEVRSGVTGALLLTI